MIRLFVAGSSLAQLSNACLMPKKTLIFISTSMFKDLTFLRSGFGGFPDNTSLSSFYITLPKKKKKKKLTREIIRINVFLQNACATYFLSLNIIWIFFRVAGCVTQKYVPRHLPVSYILQSICSFELMGIP